jgi:integrase
VGTRGRGWTFWPVRVPTIPAGDRQLLTVTGIKALKPRAKAYKVFDGRGLYLQVSPSGSKLWRFRYKFAGRTKVLSLGAFDDVSLAEARAKADKERGLLRGGIDPTAERKRRKVREILDREETFEAVALDWLKRQRWVEGHGKRIEGRLNLHVFPNLGERPIREINPVEILAILRRIEEKGQLETARRVRQTVGQVFRYGVAVGLASSDPTRDLRGILTPPEKRNFPAPRDPKRIGEILRAIDGYEGSFPVACAIRLAPRLFVRPGELRRMEWREVDFEEALWVIPAEKMKTRREYLVPLADQVLAILLQLHPVTGRGPYCFPSIGSSRRPMSDMALLAALRRLGIPKEELVTHGWRSVASTTLNEMGFNRDAIERQLAHVDRSSVRGVYNKAEYLGERRLMMKTWADYLDRLKADPESARVVVPIRRNRSG